MMWNFLKQHRQKLMYGTAAGLIIGGGSILIDRYLQRRSKKREDSLCYTSLDTFRLAQQSKKHYAFDSNQRTADHSTLEMVPTIAETIKKSFDIDELKQSAKVKNGSEKIKIWSQLKEECITRLLCFVYGITVLMLTLKTQMNFLGAKMFTKNKCLYLNGEIFVNRNAATYIRDDGNTEYAFLQTLNYFAQNGLKGLCEKMRAAVSEVVSEYELQTVCNEEKLREILTRCSRRFDFLIRRNLSYFVVPLLQSGRIDGINIDLERLICNLKAHLESEQFCLIYEWCIDFWLDAVVRFCIEKNQQLLEGMPLLRVIPMLSDYFDQFVESKENEILEIVLNCTTVRNYSRRVFEDCIQ